MIQTSTLQLLRFHFSFFLMPVYLFAISQLPKPAWARAVLIFCIFHLLVYPASNGYNSYMDRDKGSIGGIKNPMQPTKQLFTVSLVMDGIAIVLSMMISTYFAIGILLYILASRAYSYRGIRLKKYPVAGYLTVVIFQGAVTFWLVYHGSHFPDITFQVPGTGMLASSLLIGGFYPLTQIYQHVADREEGVITISALLGYRGTFVFTGTVYFFAFVVLAYHFIAGLEMRQFFILQIFMLPVLVYFFLWAVKVWKNTAHADFTHTMKMNILASTCTNLAFLTLLILRIFE
ncbi:MAG: UbiA family prenyltransferase [Chitinophagaceae bacterium]